MAVKLTKPPHEWSKIEGQPLPPARLAAIWRGLKESERLGFVLALSEDIADQVITLTAQEKSSC